MRLDKFLADHGIGTRKELRIWIKNGRVKVNGVVVNKNDQQVNEKTDLICFDDKPLEKSGFRYFLLNKPQGVISATEDGKTATVLDLLCEENIKGLAPVGRLDKDTEGLLLITDDGQLNHRLLSPKKHVDKTYEVHLAREISSDEIERLVTGVDIGDDTNTLPAKVEQQENDTEGHPMILLTIQEGRFHQVKRMLQAVDNEVLFLKRIAMGPLVLPKDLEVGSYRRLTENERKALGVFTEVE